MQLEGGSQAKERKTSLVGIKAGKKRLGSFFCSGLSSPSVLREEVMNIYALSDEEEEEQEQKGNIAHTHTHKKGEGLYRPPHSFLSSLSSSWPCLS